MKRFSDKISHHQYSSKRLDRFMRKIIETLVVLLLVASVANAQEPDEIRDTHENLNAVLWIQTSAEYRMITTSLYRGAYSSVKLALLKKNWTAAVEQAEMDVSALPPAIIVDIDETILDNSKAQALAIQKRGGFELAEWQKWVRRKEATPIPGALEFLKWAASEKNGVTVFYVTNRSVDVEPATLENLKKFGFPLKKGVDVILSRGEYGSESKSSDKSSRRKHICENYRVILMAGDDLGDFITTEGNPEERVSASRQHENFWGERWIVLPNPTYGSWERAMFKGIKEDSEILKAKFHKLKVFP